VKAGEDPRGGILPPAREQPVETRDPRPFINMTRAITPPDLRQSPRAESTAKHNHPRMQSTAYTITMARANAEPGPRRVPLKVVKSAGFIVVIAIILSLPTGGHPEKHCPTPAFLA